MTQVTPRYRWAAVVMLAGISLTARAEGAQPSVDFEVSKDSGQPGLVVTGSGYDPEGNWLYPTVDDEIDHTRLLEGPAFDPGDGTFRKVFDLALHCGHTYMVQIYAGPSPRPADASVTKQLDCGDQPHTPSSPDEHTSGKWVTGYYAVYDGDALLPDAIDWTALTHITVTKLNATAAGGVEVEVNGVTGTQADDVRTFIRSIATAAHEHHKKALLLLGGQASGTPIKAATTAQYRATFVDNLIRTVTDYGYDGIDLDWEDDIDYDQFVALARELRAKQPSWIITADANPININYETVDARVVNLVESLDQYTLMTYAPATTVEQRGWSSWHNSPLSGARSEDSGDGQHFRTPVSIDSSLEAHTKLGIARSKLSLGSGFYGVCYTHGITAPHQRTGDADPPDPSGVRIWGGDNVLSLRVLFSPQGPTINDSTRHWDAVAQVPYLSLETPYSLAGKPTDDPPHNDCRYVTYEDEQSIKAKGKFARDNGYGGIGVWTINQGNGSLFQALKQGFLDP